MAIESEIRRNIDAGKLSTKLAAIGWLLASALLIAVLVLNHFRGGELLALSALPLALAVLFGLGAMIYGMLARAASEEEEEKLLLLRRRNENRALDVEEDVRFTAGRTLANYRRFAPYVLGLLGAILTGTVLYFAYSAWQSRGFADIVGNAVNYALICAVLMLLAVFSGAFFIGQSRTSDFRWLRPMGAYLVLAFVFLLGSTISAIAFDNHYVILDVVLAKTAFGLMALLGAELVVNIVIEFYRPRTVSEVRPVFESRLLALFTEPGGVMKNVASALDYQFGFKVSGTWIYGFIERSFFPILLLWAAVFWASSMIHELGPNERGVREHFGRVIDAEPLEPGIYWTLPTPFGALRKVSCSELYCVTIGEITDSNRQSESADDGHGHREPEKRDLDAPQLVMLWTASHGSDDANFVVAVPPVSGAATRGDETASISFLRMTMPIRYRVRPDGVMDYLYGNTDPRRMLERIGGQVATAYLASSALNNVMSDGRSDAEAAMLAEVQRLADASHLGIEIVSLNLLDVHPPAGEVAAAFQNVVSAMEEKETAILAARSYSVAAQAEAESGAYAAKSGAEAYCYRTATVAKAEGKRFADQLLAYRAMPSMFRLREYLDFLEQDCRHIRKYILSPGAESEVYQLNLEEKARLDLMDAGFTRISGE